MSDGAPFLPKPESASFRRHTVTSGINTANSGADHARNAREVDQPIAALLHDLKARGLLEETLVLWAAIGRTPVTELNGDGRGPQSAGLHHVAGRRRNEAGIQFWGDR